MNWPPMLLHLRFPAEEGSWGLWLPFFLVYPLLLAISLIAAPFLLLGALVLWPAGKTRIPLLVLPYAWEVIFKTRGLLVDIRHQDHNILIDFI